MKSPADERRSPRTNVLLDGAIESGQTLFPVGVHNLSAHGALVTGEALPEAEASVVLRFNGFAVESWVAWVRPPHAGIQFADSLPSQGKPVEHMSADAHRPNEARTRERLLVTTEVGMRRSGSQSFRVKLFDASPKGCKIEFIDRPSVGERVWVKFDGLQALEATVLWVEGHIGGVQFERPLHEAVFERLATA